MLKSAFGISIPTALLPGIGASMRRERAARAIARSSARPSIRLTLMSGAGWTSYWVTTGPAFRPTTLAGIPKLASLRTMISSTWACAAASPPAWIGMAMSSSRLVERERCIRCGRASAANRRRRSRRRDGAPRSADRPTATAVAAASGRAGRPRRGERGRGRDGARDRDRDGVASGLLVLTPDAGLAAASRPGRRRRPWRPWRHRPSCRSPRAGGGVGAAGRA